MKFKIASIVTLLFLFPLLFLFAGCENISPKIIDIEIKLKDNSIYEINDNTIELTFDNSKVNLDNSDFIVTAIFDNKTSVTLSNTSTNSYKFDSTIPNFNITPVGSYTLTFSYNDFFTKSIEVIINKAPINLNSLVWSENDFEFDGVSHKPTIINLPENVFATYIYKLNGNVVSEPTEVGVYTASVILSTDDNHEIVTSSIADFNFEIKENPILKHNIFNSISLNNKNLDYLDFVNMEEISIYSSINFDLKPGYSLYAKIGETFTPIDGFNFIHNNQKIDFYYSLNGVDSKQFITTLMVKGNPLSFKLNNTDYTCGNSEIQYTYELSPNENTLTLLIDKNFVNKFYFSVNNGENKLLSNTKILIDNVKTLSNIKISFNGIKLIEIFVEQFEAIEFISVNTINPTTMSNDIKILTDNTFTGFNEFVTAINVTLKQKYAHFTTNLFKNDTLTNELTDFTDLSLNTIYLVVFNENNIPVETVELKLNYTFGDGDKNVTNFSKSYFVHDDEQFEFVMDNCSVLLDGSEDPIFCFMYDDLIITIPIEIVYIDKTSDVQVVYHFTKNITIEFDI